MHKEKSRIGVGSTLKAVAHSRAIIGELARRDLVEQHAGQIAGPIWLFIHPLMLFIVYAFFFTLVFRVRIGLGGPTDYVLYLLSGLAPWLLTQDVLVKSSQIMLANASIVKKVQFPIEALVAKSVLTSMIVQGFLLLLACAYATFVRGGIPLSFLLLLPLLILHSCLLWGFALMLGAVTPYFRDISEMLRAFVTINIYLMPVMYPPNLVPAPLRPILAFNPFSYVVWCYQDVLYFNRVEHPWAWAGLLLTSLISLVLGSYVFTRLKSHISSVL